MWGGGGGGGEGGREGVGFCLSVPWKPIEFYQTLDNSKFEDNCIHLCGLRNSI